MQVLVKLWSSIVDIIIIKLVLLEEVYLKRKKNLHLKFHDDVAVCVSCMNLRLMEFQTFYHLSLIAAKCNRTRSSQVINIRFLFSFKEHKIGKKIGATTFSSICSISMDSESNTCSFSSGAVSADVLGIVDVPILLYATSFISISFSNLRACFRKTSQHPKKKKKPELIYVSLYAINQFLPSQSDVPIVMILIQFLCQYNNNSSKQKQKQKNRLKQLKFTDILVGKTFQWIKSQRSFYRCVFVNRNSIFTFNKMHTKKEFTTKKIHSHTLECVSEFVCYTICFCNGNLEM